MSSIEITPAKTAEQRAEQEQAAEQRLLEALANMSRNEHELFHVGDVITVGKVPTKYHVAQAFNDLLIVTSARTGRRRVLYSSDFERIAVVIATEKTQKELDRRAAVAAAEAAKIAAEADMPKLVAARNADGSKALTRDQVTEVRDYLVEKGVELDSAAMRFILPSLLSLNSYGSRGVRNRYQDDKHGELGVDINFEPIVRHATIHGAAWHHATDANFSLCSICSTTPRESIVRSW